MADEQPPRDPIPIPEADLENLKKVIGKFRGYAIFIKLKDIVRIANRDFGMQETPESLLGLLEQIPEVTLEKQPVLGESCVYFPKHWFPNP
ncbi:hypothetical protein DTL21_05400 [Bremerella cremea]|uniref:Uncharacterized protein n=1 Tax=Blastopirellula marina TaxID=124 RepID=A0A2S8FZ79_9BACT|nr:MULTISPECIES: hypothetical protein [Pirellulaceae]PQO37380.1 hypothetical protein C5Y83_05400 [Blastopirellula marina]RCS49767.1 hypothetical protein DTL21_05400 [Bremerella cremea]